MKKTGAILIFTCVITMLFGGCGKEVNEEDFLSDFGNEYADNYTILDTNDDGILQISVIAPDIEELVKIMVEDNEKEDLDIEKLQDAIDNYPDCEKEYIFEINEATDSAIKEKLYEEIAKELIIAAIDITEFRDEWSTGE